MIQSTNFGNSTKKSIHGKKENCSRQLEDEYNTRRLHVPGIEIAAQNCHQEDSGAFTGEISISMLTSLGLEYVVLGHSERRQYFGETNELLNIKLKKVIEAGMTPIFCCGESLDTRKASGQNDFVIDQLKKAFEDIDKERISKIIIAYEPIWAIGTGETATPEQAQNMHAVIRSFLKSEYGSEISEGISILYGGSVKESNAKEIFGQKDVDGGLVGGASLKFDSFSKIIHSF
jgi:triosephosphate isomerase